MSSAFGRKSLQVRSPAGSEVFSIGSSTKVLNPSQLRWSFRVLPPASASNDDVFFTVNRDALGRGPLGLREQWRVYRGRARESDEVYYCVGSVQGWKYRFYRAEADFKAGCTPVAKLDQVDGTGSFRQEQQRWIPAQFVLNVGPGEDSALLLSVATILDTVHERSFPGQVSGVH
jgi:hypothetical protein